MPMSVLTKLFNPDASRYSPVKEDVTLVIKKTKEGNIPTWIPVDYKEITASLGKVKQWSLRALMAAGVDPAFPIHTGYNTRADGLGALSEFESAADAILADAASKSDETSNN